MHATGPRPSILSLFDPLSSADSDKENNAAESSFLGTHRRVYTPLHKPRRRLIDIGDMTMDEPDMRDLLAEEEDELEMEINDSVTAGDDENDTLTFRDMAKAATPKWSARRPSHLLTPSSSPSIRLPLSEIAVAEDTTPLARMRTFKSQAPSKPTLVETTTGQPSDPLFSDPATDVSTEQVHNAAPQRGTLASVSSPSPTIDTSTVHLELPTFSETDFSCTNIPLLVSPSSPVKQENQLPTIFHDDVRLRVTDVNVNANRQSVDLHASFQLQLNSEATFDLLNDKISFFSSQSVSDSALRQSDESHSFDEEDFILVLKDRKESLPMIDVQADLGNIQNGKAPADIPLRADPVEVLDNLIAEDSTQTKAISEVSQLPVDDGGIRKVKKVLEVPRNTALLDFANNASSTPRMGSMVAPQARPVHALKIVKRTKIGQERSGPTIEANGGKVPLSTSTSTTSLQVQRRRSEVTVPGRAAESSDPQKATRRIGTNMTTQRPGDGPRRIIVENAPKAGPRIQPNGKQTSGAFAGPGPRRIPLVGREQGNAEGVARSTGHVAMSNSGTVAGIPKPVSRSAGSRLPSLSKQRFGVPSGLVGPNKGLESRRGT